MERCFHKTGGLTVSEDKPKDEIDRLRSIISPVRENLERGSRVKRALARLRARKPKKKKMPDDTQGAA